MTFPTSNVPFYLHPLTAPLECESDANRSSLKLINLQNWECDTMSEVPRWLEFLRIWLVSSKATHLNYVLQLFLPLLQCRCCIYFMTISIVFWLGWNDSLSHKKSQKYWQQNTGRIRLRCGNLTVKSELGLFAWLCPYLEGDGKRIENRKPPKPNIYAKWETLSCYL